MNKKGFKGFTVVELIVTLFIIGLVLSAAYSTYLFLLKGFKSEGEKTISETESLVGLEILRLDLSHIGYGIPANETAKLIDFSSGSLILRSTLNNTEDATKGYVIGKCVNTGDNKLSIIIDAREDTTNNFVSIIDTKDKNFFDKGTISGTNVNLSSNSCTQKDDVHIAFPVRQQVYNGTSNGCSVSVCEQISYILSSSNLLDRCNPNTKNLIRRVGTGTTGGEPVLNCVADFKVKFRLDTNNDGVIDTSLDTLSALSNTTIRQQLKKVDVYILYQEGQKDKDYTFSGSTTIDGVNLTLPTNYSNYRWKVIKLSIKPMDL